MEFKLNGIKEIKLCRRDFVTALEEMLDENCTRHNPVLAVEWDGAINYCSDLYLEHRVEIPIDVVKETLCNGDYVPQEIVDSLTDDEIREFFFPNVGLKIEVTA